MYIVHYCNRKLATKNKNCWLPAEVALKFLLSICVVTYNVTPHHQMRHKWEIQKLRFHNVIEEIINFELVKELSFYHNYKLDYD